MLQSPFNLNNGVFMSLDGLSNQSYIAQYLYPVLGDAFDTVTGRNFFHGKLSPIVNSAIGKDKKKLDILRKELMQRPGVERVGFNAVDGTPLDGVLIKGETQPAKGVIFLALGRDGCYESIANPKDLASEFVNFFQTDVGKDVDIFVINPREIGESNGTASYEGWVLDIYSGIKELRSRGYEPANTLLYGHSLGAWLSSDAVNAIKKDGEIAVASDRSFTNFADLVSHHVGGGAQGLAVYLLATYAKWNADITDSLNSASSRKIVIYSPDDTTVKPEISVFKRQTEKRHESQFNHFVIKGGEHPHARPFTDSEKAELAPRLRELMNLPLISSQLSQ